jgi:hypothetical protein
LILTQNAAYFGTTKIDQLHWLQSYDFKKFLENGKQMSILTKNAAHLFQTLVKYVHWFSRKKAIFSSKIGEIRNIGPRSLPVRGKRREPQMSEFLKLCEHVDCMLEKSVQLSG